MGGVESDWFFFKFILKEWLKQGHISILEGEVEASSSGCCKLFKVVQKVVNSLSRVSSDGGIESSTESRRQPVLTLAVDSSHLGESRPVRR